jgi:Kef-type K+ transport system membrane component KefB
MGMILGPYMINLLGDFSGAFMLAGEIGLLLLVLEAGVEVDLTMLKMVGPLGVAVAVFGSICPMAIGYGLSYAYGYGTRVCAPSRIDACASVCHAGWLAG